MLRAFKQVLPFLVALIVGRLYLHTLAPGLTWAYDGADGGDLIAALATGGVPHPSGYPTYLLLAGWFIKLPLGSLAFRTNLFSGLCMSLAVFFLYQFVLRLEGKVLPALFASLAFGTFPLIWSQALITEIYALQALLTILVLVFLVSLPSHPILDLLGGLLAGLALGNHLTSLFLLPLLFLDNTGQLKLKNRLKAPRMWGPYLRLLGLRLVGLLLGASLYLTIPLRASGGAPVNWGQAVTLDGFWWLISGKMYQGRLVHFSPAYLLSGLRLWSGFLLEQMTLIGLLVAVMTLVVLFKPVRLYFVTGWLALFYSLFAILYYSPDSYVYLIPALVSFSVWIGLGLAWLVERLPKRTPLARPILVVGILALLTTRAVLMIPEMDLSNDHTAELFGQTVLESVPERAIVITNGDESLFSLWYFQYAEHLRPDVAVVSDELLSQAWYHAVLQTTYPDLNVPDGFDSLVLSEANPQRPLCKQGEDLSPAFHCSP
jgi:hypothetical protein